jgi:hypothetical protein
MSTENVNQNPAHAFYQEALQYMKDKQTPFLMGGAFALRKYTGIYRDTKDLDIFCKASDYGILLRHMAEKGFKTEITDPRWLAKAFKDEHFIDFIFNTTNNICAVDDSWYEHSTKGELFGVEIDFIAPEEMLWSKIYVQNRERYDGADVNHIILKCGKTLDWKRIMTRIEQHWHLLLAQFLNFQFVYPSEREAIPRWLFEELLEKARIQYELPTPIAQVCLGPLVDHTSYLVDVSEWNYKTITTRSV